MKTSDRVSTRYISAERAAELINAKGLAASLRGIAQYIEADFRRWGEFDKTARVASHSHDGVIELMPIADHAQYAFKYVNGHPKNHRFNLPTVMAFGVLAEVSTGIPTVISELTLTTALRTAATSAMAAKLLARPNSRRMAIIGNGAQSEFQALAFHHLLGIQEFHLFDTDPAASRKLRQNLATQGLAARVLNSTAEAVKGCDIVTTITADKANATILTPAMIEPGMHLNAVGGDCPGKTELHRAVLEMATTFAEYAPQTRVEGEIQQMPSDYPVTEIWQVLVGSAAGRTHAEQVTLFDSVGFALEDYAALRFMADLATELGMDDRLSLIPSLPDPKNLFAFLLHAPNSPHRPHSSVSTRSIDAEACLH